MSAITTDQIKRRTRGQRGYRNAAWAPYLLIAPSVLAMLGFLVYPMASVFYYSLQHYHVSQPWENGFAGLDNFKTLLFDDPLFWQSLLFSLKWVGVEVTLQFILGLALALIVNESFVGRALSRALVFSPWAVSGVLTTGIWVLLYNPTTGVSRYLADLNLIEYGFAPLAKPDTVFWAAVLAELWRGVPFFAILLLADLQTTSKDLYEAASVDGASRMRRFIHITLPHLKDAIILSTLLRAVWEFNNVDLLFTLTGGGPAHQTTTLPLYVATTAAQSHNFGYGSALTTAAVVLLTFFSVAYLRLSKFGARS